MASTKTLYFFSDEFPEGHSLLKWNISLPPQQQEEEDGHGQWNVSSPQLICHLYSPTDTFYRTEMGCGKFGSELYILGGVSRPKNSGDIVDYPLDVMVFDTAAPSDAALNRTRVRKMNFPKVSPLVFEVGGKLYVLGVLRKLFNCLPSGPHIFEEYDPQANQWKILKSPVEEKTSYEWGFSFVSNSNKIVVQARCLYTVHIFDPTTSVWTTLDITYPCRFRFNSIPASFDDCLYWPQDEGTFMQIAPLSINQSTKVPIIEWGGGIDSNPFFRFRMCSALPHKLMMIHLGDRLFCLLESTSAYNDDIPEPFSIRFHIYVHKVTQLDDGRLWSKCLHKSSLEFETEPDWIGPFTAVHLISNDMQQVPLEGKFDGPDPKRRKH